MKCVLKGNRLYFTWNHDLQFIRLYYLSPGTNDIVNETPYQDFRHEHYNKLFGGISIGDSIEKRKIIVIPYFRVGGADVEEGRYSFVVEPIQIEVNYRILREEPQMTQKPNLITKLKSLGKSGADRSSIAIVVTSPIYIPKGMLSYKYNEFYFPLGEITDGNKENRFSVPVPYADVNSLGLVCSTAENKNWKIVRRT